MPAQHGVTPLKDTRKGRSAALKERGARVAFRRLSRGATAPTAVDGALCTLFKPARLRLPEIDLVDLFPHADDVEIRLSRLPRGAWSSPVADLVSLCKLITLAAPHRVLEVGSFRGYTAHGIATHLPEGARLVTVDVHPEHGEAYRGTPVEERIERRTGPVGAEMFDGAETATYDLIFLDADHRYDAVKHDTDVVMPLLSKDGWFVWHDYANWGFFSGANGVPEFIDELATAIPIAQLSGTNMAVHRPAWTDGVAREAWERAISARAGRQGRGWEDTKQRP